jgi:hypothetical protein
MLVLLFPACDEEEDDATPGAQGDAGNSTVTPPGDAGGYRPDFEVCASSGAALPTPTNIVIMFDKSGSMGDASSGFDPKSRWIPVTQAMEAFVVDPASARMNASLQFFPMGATSESATLEQNNAVVCSYDYKTPSVSMSSLSKPAKFKNALDVTSPSGGTPTLPALKGAIDYAKEVSSAAPTEKVVVLLVTDGEPGMVVDQTGAVGPGCKDNDVNHVAMAAKTAFEGAPSIATYVIGVGPSVSSLNAVASAGGTGSAFIVDVNDPSKTAGIVSAALQSIRDKVRSCDFALPAAPAGKTLDFQKASVSLVGATTKTVPQSADCANADGWHFDNPTSPTKLTVCPAACTAIQSDPAAKIQLDFGCH